MGFHFVSFSRKDSERLECLGGRGESGKDLGSKGRESRDGLRGTEFQGFAHLVELGELE